MSLNFLLLFFCSDLVICNIYQFIIYHHHQHHYRFDDAIHLYKLKIDGFLLNNFLKFLVCYTYFFFFLIYTCPIDQATANPKVKNRISLELSFVNSNLQLLKEKLSELNASVEIYQNDIQEVLLPFIPIGLKETVDINFMDTFTERVSENSCFIYTFTFEYMFSKHATRRSKKYEMRNETSTNKNKNGFGFIFILKTTIR